MRKTIVCLVLLGVLLAGCAQTQPVPPSSALPTAAPTAASSPNPAPTAAPTAAPTSAPTATPLPTATPAPSPTPDPWAEYRPYTIEALRARSYGQGEITIERTLEQTANFTRYLFSYTSDGLRITGMLNRPAGEGPFPVVLLSHGYYPLDVYQTGNGTRLAADYLAERGFLTLSPDFRSHAGSDDAPNLFRAGHVIDLLNLIPLAQRLPSAQPGKVGLWGHSNGGAITAKAMTISDQVGAALVYAPASLTIAEDYAFRVERWQRRAGQPPGRRSGVIDRLEIEFPVTPEQAPELYQQLSPLPYLALVDAPVQIHWGSADETVPYKWPGDLLDGLRAAGKQVEYFEYPGQPHSFQGASNQRYLARMAEFFATHLRPAAQ
ncbi:MAG: alpha/beta fold hydrolase [Roseiflexaceae bacterium]